jgi:hypothetical protein
MIIKIPAYFYIDHVSRSDAPEELDNAIIKNSGRYFLVELDSAQLNNLLSDAEYYADGVDYPELRGLQRSAVATVKAITKLGEIA